MVPTRRNVNMCTVTATHPLFPAEYLLLSMLKFPSRQIFLNLQKHLVFSVFVFSLRYYIFYWYQKCKRKFLLLFSNTYIIIYYHSTSKKNPESSTWPLEHLGKLQHRKWTQWKICLRILIMNFIPMEFMDLLTEKHWEGILVNKTVTISLLWSASPLRQMLVLMKCMQHIIYLFKHQYVRQWCIPVS